MNDEDNNKKKKGITYAIGIIFFLLIAIGVVYLAVNFRSIMVSLGMPVSPGWNPNYKDKAPESNVSETNASEDPEFSAEWLDMYLADFLYLDFSPFSDPSEIKQSDMVDYAAILCAKSPDADYEITEMGEVLIPAEKVKLKENSYFGVSVPDKGGNFTSFDKEKNVYRLSIAGYQSKYIAVISGYKYSSDKITVNVNFYDYSSAEEGVPASDKAVKKMAVTLKGNFPDYKIVSYVEQK